MSKKIVIEQRNNAKIEVTQCYKHYRIEQGDVELEKTIIGYPENAPAVCSAILEVAEVKNSEDVLSDINNLVGYIFINAGLSMRNAFMKDLNEHYHLIPKNK